jgi:hypothetical protein
VTLQQLNWEKLKRDNLHAKSCASAEELIDKSSSSKALRKSFIWLLRHHESWTIDNEEMLLRDDIDNLLEFYGLIELALDCGVFSVDTLGGDASAILKRLGDPIFKTYYEYQYPFRLATMLRMRLASHDNNQEKIENGCALFSAFLQIRSSIDSRRISLDPGWGNYLRRLEMVGSSQALPVACRFRKRSL